MGAREMKPVLLLAVMVACGSPPTHADDSVQTEGRAIEIAHKSCLDDNPKGHWSAQLQDVLWYATYEVEGLPKGCPALSVYIRASDGAIRTMKGFSPVPSAAGCNICAY
jgi:hypothetical protein